MVSEHSPRTVRRPYALLVPVAVRPKGVAAFGCGARLHDPGYSLIRPNQLVEGLGVLHPVLAHALLAPLEELPRRLRAPVLLGLAPLLRKKRQVLGLGHKVVGKVGVGPEPPLGCCHQVGRVLGAERLRARDLGVELLEVEEPHAVLDVRPVVVVCALRDGHVVPLRLGHEPLVPRHPQKRLGGAHKQPLGGPRQRRQLLLAG
mmetsp:Transcript_43397/g.108780  ORF Transcript_43397/g.108780 Transcript_43397/m.108780 type:complete len:203 (-) Transcript_43397:365-973(-)